ncbi:hypothetical protein FXN63_23740 [Pigmentiphaga aceris]|uniref:Uncharacterized protein n=1 Tax=Pigmentiphaga aceris TaxID=1940612 RepID=A0A5C0B1Q7_9BURK|nr:hypothetical protein [Pigmentiphaga aceris]QEI08512.1 hypothetical protein FXN63_23740 [Pigmentiphaga aceris]
MTVSRHHPALIWAGTLALAFLIAYAANPVVSTLLLAADRWGGMPPSGMKFISVVQVVVFALSLFWLLRMARLQQRIGNGLKTAGILFLLSLPAMIVIAIVENTQATSGDHGSAAAAFFMVLIFGGAYGVIGAALLIGGIVIARRDKAQAAGA